MLAEILLKYLNGETFDEIFLIKKNIEQQCLTNETYNSGYEIMIKPWNPYKKKFGSLIIMK